MKNNAVEKNLRVSSRRCVLGLKMVAASFLLLLLGFSNSASAFQITSDASSILAAYNSAIYDSAVYKFSNVRPLNPLKFDPKTKSATVVTLTNFDYTDKGKYRPPFRIDSGNYYIWVTAAPEVQNVCRTFAENELKLGLEQLLGLKPNSSFTHFITMEITSGQAFRPTANPDPTTKYPCSTTDSAADSDTSKPVIPDNCGEVFPEGVYQLDHKIWFANQMLSSYVAADTLDKEGYPWTRLGYTYNWKPGADKYGASEYVIKLNSVVTIKEIIPFEKYCQAPPEKSQR